MTSQVLPSPVIRDGLIKKQIVCRYERLLKKERKHAGKRQNEQSKAGQDAEEDMEGRGWGGGTDFP
jgi:hypothetical protein